MRFTVTPLGGARSDTQRVVSAIVRYLHPRTTESHERGLSATPDETPSRYYADRGEEPGRWLGSASAAAELVGEVDREDFAIVLAGRDPSSGTRLITAQGSAGRRPRLGAGNHTGIGADGQAFYGVADAAAALGVSRVEVSRMLDVGTAVLLSVLPVPGCVPGPVPGDLSAQLPGSFLVPVLDRDGSRWVTQTELDRCLDARADGVDHEVIATAGAADDQFPLAEAARLAGVTSRYLRRLAGRYDQNRDTIETIVRAGRPPRHAYVVAHRGTRGQWLVSRQNLVEFVRRRRPPAVRVGYDVTLTTEKSLGVLALLSDRDTGRLVLDAIQDGNDWAIEWLERHAAIARVDGKPVNGTGWMVASFRHLTSRSLDPFPHHHNVVANTVALADGSRRALDARYLYRHARSASALATAEVRHLLTTKLGIRWRPGRKGGWEIAGIPDSVLVEFSRRRNEIDDALAELAEAIGHGVHPADIEHVVLRTRPAKSHTPADALLAEWWQRAVALGFDPGALRNCHGRATSAAEPDRDVLFASLSGPDGICASGSVFSRGDALVALADHPVPDPDGGDPQPLLLGAAGLEQLTEGFLASTHVVQIGDGLEPLFTTAEMLAVQDRVVTRFRRGLHRGAAFVHPDAVAVACGRHDHLTAEQRALVESWCTSGHRYQTAIGRAGAGKTTTVAAAVDAWTAAGYRVVGAAVKGEAARTLARATGIGCETIAWYLAHDDPHRQPLDSRTVLVVDEASTLSDRDLDRLMTVAADTGATLRLIGDPAQHGAVAAGGMYRVLCERHSIQTPELATTHRLLHPADRTAAEALRAGQIDMALDALDAAGHLHIVDDELSLYRDVLARWWDAHLAGLDHPMVDRRNRIRRQLNQLAHLLRQANNELGPDEILTTGNRRFSPGDRVTARAANRQLHVDGDRRAYVRNGACGTITAIELHPNVEQDTMTVAFDGIGTITIPRSFFDRRPSGGSRAEVGIDHAYALTSYAVQGATHDVSTSRIDAGATRSETYVDITRGRTANHLYITHAADTLDGEHLPRLPLQPADEAVAAQLRRSTTEVTAWELANKQQPREREAISR